MSGTQTDPRNSDLENICRLESTNYCEVSLSESSPQNDIYFYHLMSHQGLFNILILL